MSAAAPDDPLGSVGAALAALDDGRSAEDLAAEALARIDAAADLGAFLAVDRDGALAAARDADARRASGERTPLLGVPVAVKDIFCTEGLVTTAGSRMLADWVPPYDADLVERLRRAGAVIVGKTNMDEFAMGSSGENSAFGPTRNPWDRGRVPGGSSSGSAAAVAAGLVPAAYGTDTGGSIRQPAAFCGLTGLKPTYGRCSRWGMIAFASSLDSAGPLVRDAEDAARLLQVAAGADARDSTSAEADVPDYLAACAEDVAGRTVGLPTALLGDDLAPEVRAAVDATRAVLEGLGAHIVDVDLPTALAGVPAYYVIAPAEASSNLSRFDGVRFGHRCENPADLADLYRRSRAEGFGAEVKRRILTGTYALSVGYYDAYYRHAQRVRRRIRDEFVEVFGRVDAILAPTAPSTAFALGRLVDDPVTMYLQDVFTIPASLAGTPAISIPAGFHDGLPIGVQLLAGHFGETTLLALAAAIQRETDHHRARAPAPERAA